MNPTPRNLLFLLGLAPLACADSKGSGEDETGTDEVGDEIGSTESSSEGTSTGTGTESTTEESTTDEGESTKDSGDLDSESTESSESATSDSGETGNEGGLCENYAQHYADCYVPRYEWEVLQWCKEQQGWYQLHGSPACFDAWEAAIDCQANNDECYQGYDACYAQYVAFEQECYYNDGIYSGCTLYGNLVAECVGVVAGETADLECEQTYEQLYEAYSYSCGYAFYELMTCISQLDCAALDDPLLVEAGCGPELAAHQQECM